MKQYDWLVTLTTNPPYCRTLQYLRIFGRKPNSHEQEYMQGNYKHFKKLTVVLAGFVLMQGFLPFCMSAWF
jgi:hypothetical protein